METQAIIEAVFLMVAIFLLATYGSRFLVWLLKNFTKRTETELDGILLVAVRPQIGWLIAAIGFKIATTRLDFITGMAESVLENTYFILLLFVIIASAWRAGDAYLDWYVAQKKSKLNKNLTKQIFPLLKRLSHLCLVIIFIAVLASHFGINVLAISAALGLGGFAIALAAQDTISNIISGFVIMFDSSFKIGDRIEITGIDTWGDVTSIGMRSTQVRTRDNRLVVVPNTNIVDSTVINYSMPDKTYRLQSDIGIGYDMDIRKTQELIRGTVRKLEGVLKDKPVDVWFTEFGDSSMTFRVRWWVKSYTEKRQSIDRVNAAIQELSEKKGINMPNPTITLDNNVKLTDKDIKMLAEALKKSK